MRKISALKQWREFAALLALLPLTSCISVPPPAPQAIGWRELPGWQAERPAEAWVALERNCARLRTRVPAWRELCAEAALFAQPDDDTARAFFETRFEAVPLRDEDGGSEGLITGYYEPLLHGSTMKSGRFRYPLYGRPDDLVTIDLGELYPELRDRRLRGRLVGRRVLPYPARAEIASNGAPNAPVIAWVDDPVALFFLQVQGSGRLQLADGRHLRVGYADQNGHPYQAIGRRLIELGALSAEQVSLQSIRAWLAANPAQAEAMLNSNPSYVFFELRNSDLPGPLGTLNVPLAPERAVAVDPSRVPLGSLLYLDTRLPANADTALNGESEAGAPFQRLVFAQDTGGAIKGAVRADLFFGFGPRAEWLAGHMKSRGRLFLLQPRARSAGD